MIAKLLAGNALLLIGLGSSAVGAAPVWLECRASGPAGTVTFRFDEAAKQASTSWSAGGGRPARAHFGETGTEAAFEASFTMTSISAAFQNCPVNDPYAYRVNIGRTDGSMAFIRYDGSVRISNGTCSSATSPTRMF
ncbi:MAG: hypothetical protein NTV97_21940 [Alphaproteobacteria bacterium]|nr:hypothetical protein [Alphaproteobacteria bacterium]